MPETWCVIAELSVEIKNTVKQEILRIFIFEEIVNYKLRIALLTNFSLTTKQEQQ